MDYYILENWEHAFSLRQKRISYLQKRVIIFCRIVITSGIQVAVLKNQCNMKKGNEKLQKTSEKGCDSKKLEGGKISAVCHSKVKLIGAGCFQSPNKTDFYALWVIYFRSWTMSHDSLYLTASNTVCTDWETAIANATAMNRKQQNHDMGPIKCFVIVNM